MPSNNAAPLTLSTFVISVASSGLVHLGVREPGGPERPIDLHIAQQSLDLLELLSTKTKGNLDDEEARLLEAVINDLRHRLAEASASAR
jgi:tRNA splicing endonuclease